MPFVFMYESYIIVYELLINMLVEMEINFLRHKLFSFYDYLIRYCYIYLNYNRSQITVTIIGL